MQKKQQRLSERQVKFRKELLLLAWKEYKNSLTMQEMAEVFRMNLGQFFRIVKESTKKK